MILRSVKDHSVTGTVLDASGKVLFLVHHMFLVLFVLLALELGRGRAVRTRCVYHCRFLLLLRDGCVIVPAQVFVGSGCGRRRIFRRVGDASPWGVYDGHQRNWCGLEVRVSCFLSGRLGSGFGLVEKSGLLELCNTHTLINSTLYCMWSCDVQLSITRHSTDLWLGVEPDALGV